MNGRTLSIITVIWILAAWAFPVGVAAQAPERFEGILASTAGGAGGFAQIRIQIEEYTTEAEVLEFVDILSNRGWEGLEKAFLDVEKGRFIRSGQLGHDIAFARSLPHETGRIIRLATARPIAFAEAAGVTRSREYALRHHRAASRRGG